MIKDRPKTGLRCILYRLACQRYLVKLTQSIHHSFPGLLSIKALAGLRNLCNRNSHYVALKIKTAETSMDNSGLSILRYLNQQRNSDPMSRHVITLLDCFEYQGPNGKHVCIEFEALSASVSSLLEQSLEYINGIVLYRYFPGDGKRNTQTSPYWYLLPALTWRHRWRYSRVQRFICSI